MIITGNLFARGYGVGGVVMMMFMGGDKEGDGEDDLDFPNHG